MGPRPNLAGCSKTNIEWPWIFTKLDLGGHGSMGMELDDEGGSYI